MNSIASRVTAERLRAFFLYVLFFSIPFSIAGDDFAIIGLYLVTIYLFVRGREKWIHHAMIYGMAVFLAGFVVSSVFSDQTLTSFSYIRNLWRLGLPFLVFLGLKDRDHRPFIMVTLSVSCIVAVYSIVQAFTGIDWLRSSHLDGSNITAGSTWHAVGAFSHHLTYGGVSLILFSLFTPSVFNSSLSTRRRLIYVAGSLLNLAAIILCLGRSIWLGMIAAVGVMVLLQIRIRFLKYLLIFSILGIGIYSQVDSTVKRAFFEETTIGRRINSYTIQANIDRIMMWSAAVDIIADHPILGLGPRRSEIMQPYYDRTAAKYHHKFQHKAHVGVHNIYLQNWIDFGILGLAGYLSWFFILIGGLITTIKRSPAFGNNLEGLATGLVAAFSGILIAGFFENNFRDGEVQTAILTAMGLSLLLIFRKRNAGSKADQPT